MVNLVILTGGTEELVFSWVPLSVGEVTALLTAPLAVRRFAVAVSLPAALAEMEHDAGNLDKTLLSSIVWSHLSFWLSVASTELSPTVFPVCDAGERLALLYDSSLFCTGGEKATQEFTAAEAFRRRSFFP